MNQTTQDVHSVQTDNRGLHETVLNIESKSTVSVDPVDLFKNAVENLVPDNKWPGIEQLINELVFYVEELVTAEDPDIETVAISVRLKDFATYLNGLGD